MTVPVVCFGEMLWDLLPSGAQPGGAPMNVAYHLNKLGVAPTLISRVGPDDYGKRLLQLLQEQKLSTRFVQQDEAHRTGLVYAEPNEQHEVTYEIAQPAAWDFIEWDNRFGELLQQSEYFVYGSLSARSATSRQTLFRLLESANKRVCDINIRMPHFQQQTALQLLQQVDVLKLNETELPVLAGWLGRADSFEEKLQLLQNRFRIPIVVVTRGAAGAVLNVQGRLYQHPGYKVTVADTVGSGDAFLAGLLSQLHKGASPETALDFACATGALVASYSGACPSYQLSQIEHLMPVPGSAVQNRSL